MKKLLLILIFSASQLLSFTSTVHAESNPAKPCLPGESRYRPGGDCERTTPSIEGNITDYPLTCQDIPIATLSSDGLYPPLTSYRRTLTSDISQAELGGLGPNATAINSYSPDSLAQVYAFIGLFDKPVSMQNEPREAARTYWRLMSTYDQANAKAAYFELVKNSQFVNNTTIEFHNPAKVTSPTPTSSTTTSAGSLRGSATFGPNIGYGHRDQKFCDAVSGRPVTFLIDLSASIEDLNYYKTCYSSASIRILKIRNFDPSTPLANFSSAGTIYSSVFGNDKDYLVLGNELNTLDAMYKCTNTIENCASTYASQFAAFKSTFTGPHLSATPMNTSHPTYDAAKFLDSAKSAYQASTFLANNAYHSSGGCPFEAIRCTKDSYKWVNQHLGLSLPVVLSEYGLAPPNDDSKLANVVAFYATLPTDVIAITPLIRNVCLQAKGEWLYFNQANQVVDVAGKVIDSTSCNPVANSLIANDKITVLDLMAKLGNCLTRYPVCADFMKNYLELSAADRNAYDALLPFNFDNIRGYQVLNQVVYKENLPYVKAIVDGLNNSKSGLLNLLSPSWINDLRATNLKTNSNNPSRITDDTAMKQAIITHASPYDPANCLDHNNSTYLPSPITYPAEISNNNNVKLDQEVNIRITSINREQVVDPITHITSTKYVWSGSAEGKPVIVANNPKLEDLSLSIKGPQSLTAMLLPNAGLVPNRDMAAPVAILGANNNDTSVEGKTYEEGKARIARTGGESQTKLCELRNKWLIPAGLQRDYVDCVNPAATLTKSGSIAPPFTGSTSTTTSVNCNKTAQETSVPGLHSKAVIADIASRWLSNVGHNYVNECYNDVVGRAVGAGINPAFALWIWVHESGASNYEAYTHPIQDFGINDASVENNFTTQITRFLGLPRAYKAQYSHCYQNSYNEMQNFIRIYFIGATAPGTPCLPTQSTLDYYDQMRSTWNWVSTTPFPTNPFWP